MRVAGRAQLDSSFECLIEPALAGLVLELAGVGSLGDSERAALLGGARQAIVVTVGRKLARTPLLMSRSASIARRSLRTLFGRHRIRDRRRYAKAVVVSGR